MAVNIKLEFDGITEFNRTFLRLDERISDLTPIWDEVRDEVFRIEKEQFESEGAAGRGGKWKPLSKRYAEQKQKRFPGAKILERTGRGKKSLTSVTSDTIYNKRFDGMELGTRVPYMAHHHRGAGRLPERKVYSFSENQKRRLTKTIQAELITLIRRGL